MKTKSHNHSWANLQKKKKIIYGCYFLLYITSQSTHYWWHFNSVSYVEFVRSPPTVFNMFWPQKLSKVLFEEVVCRLGCWYNLKKKSRDGNTCDLFGVFFMAVFIIIFMFQNTRLWKMLLDYICPPHECRLPSTKPLDVPVTTVAHIIQKV